MPNTASTNNWDTVSAIKFKSLNAAIKNLHSSPSSFSGNVQSPSGDQAVIAADFGDWQLSGGSGGLVHMKLPFSSATSEPPGGSKTDLGDGFAVIEVDLTYIPQPGETESRALKIDAEHAVTSADVTMAENDNRNWGPYVSEALTTWLKTHLQSFNHVFAVVNLGFQEENKTFRWLKPTKVGYAVEVVGDNVDDYVFAVLAMTENRPGSGLSDQVSPFAIPSGADAGFLISTERFMEKMVLPGVYPIFKGAGEGDFDITADGTQVTNVKELNFETFEVPTNKSGTETKPISDAKVSQGNFRLTAFDRHMRFEFTDLTYTWKSGFIVHVNYTGISTLEIDSTNHLQMPETSDPTVNFTVTKTVEEEWKEIGITIAVDIGIALASALIGGAAEAMAAKEAADTAVTQTVREAIGDAGADASIDGAVNIPLLTQEEREALQGAMVRDALEGAAEQLANPSAMQKFSGFFMRNWKVVLGGMIAEAIGTVATQIPNILNSYAENDLAKMPTLDKFATEAVSPIQWTDTPSFKLDSIALNGPVQMGLKYD